MVIDKEIMGISWGKKHQIVNFDGISWYLMGFEWYITAI
jgi:hypothetical protein